MDRSRRQAGQAGPGYRPGTCTSSLSFAARQMVSGMRVLAMEERTRHEPIVILDEPTTVLDGGEVDLLFSKLRSLKDRASIISFLTTWKKSWRSQTGSMCSRMGKT